MHTATDPLQFSVPLQTQIASLDPELPVSDVLTMNQIIGASLVNASLSATRVGLRHLWAFSYQYVGYREGNSATDAERPDAQVE